MSDNLIRYKFHNRIIKLIAMLMIMSALVIYYFILGPTAFPDYDNYLTIARNGGYLFAPNEYFFEYFSRGILTNKYIVSESAVDLLVFISQCFTIFYMIYLIKEKPWNGLIQSSLTSVSFLTTIIRAAPAYEVIGFLCAGSLSLKKILICSIIALSWHDTAAIPIAIVTFIYFTRYLRINSILVNLFNKIYLFGIAIFLFSEKFKLIIENLIGSIIGIRSIYFETDGGHSLLKIIYSVGIYLSTIYLIKNSKMDSEKKLIIYGLNMVGALIYSINSVAGIRFSLFTITVFLAMYDFSFLNHKFYKYFFVIAFVGVYIYSYIDILKNTI